MAASFTRSPDWHAGVDTPETGAALATPQPVAPADRLRATRARLRQALLADDATMAPAATDASTADGAAAFTPDAPAFLDQLVRVLRNAVAEGIAGRPASAIVGGAAIALVGPTAQRHPVALVSAAAATGAAIALLRPWRWGHPMRRARHRDPPRAPHGVPAALAGVLAAVPIGTWLALLQWTMHRAALARAQPLPEGTGRTGKAG